MPISFTFIIVFLCWNTQQIKYTLVIERKPFQVFTGQHKPKINSLQTTIIVVNAFKSVGNSSFREFFSNFR